MLAAAVAMAWQGRADVPDNVDLHSGTCLTWGNDLVWGVFPTSGGTGTTYVYAYHPEADTWDSIEPMAGVFLDHTGITFQWIEQPVLWGIGRHENLSKLYWYFQDSAQWRQDTIDTFALDDGACIAYVPNVNYTRQMNPVPGWIYCLPDDERSFWRCALPTSLPNVALDGIYPGQGATIAELTPLFQWEGAATNQYRLQVSTDLFFIQNVIDEVVSSPEYEPTTELANVVLDRPQLLAPRRLGAARQHSIHRGRWRGYRVRRRELEPSSHSRVRWCSRNAKEVLRVQHRAGHLDRVG
jgi:hypothetical protein